MKSTVIFSEKLRITVLDSPAEGIGYFMFEAAMERSLSYSNTQCITVFLAYCWQN